MIPRYDARSSQESYPFFYARPDSAALQELRETYRLEALTAPCDQDLCRLERVCAWVNGLWEHDGDNEPSAPDALTILGEVARGKRFRCVEFGTVVASCAAALGLPSRVVGLKTADCETREYGAGHVVTEVYLRDKRSWVMVDGQWNVIPVADGRPLSALGLRDALNDGERVTSLTAVSGEQVSEFLAWIDKYLFYFETQFDNRELGVEGKARLLLVPFGAPEPTVFQRKWPMKDVTYTHSAKAFYSVP